MSRALVAALLAWSTVATAQTAPEPQPETPPTQPAPAPAPEQPATTPPAPAAATEDNAQALEEKLEAAKKEMREEIRAQLATQSAAQGWEEEWVEQSKKLELVEIDGYFRTRPDLFHKLDLNRAADPSGFTLFPRPLTGTQERTLAGVNMRLRLEPTINVSEEVRVKMQIDALDNILFGSTPLYANTRSLRHEFAIFNNTQVPPTAGLNSFTDSIQLKRVYGEVSTPVGILRFGRMGSHWGLGMLHNDGNCIDCDFGDTVDRFQFVTEPFAGWYVAPMVDFNVEGPDSGVYGEQGQPFDLSNTDDAHSYVVAIARRDTEQQERAKLENNLAVLNYGLHFTYRTQRFAPTGWADLEPEVTGGFVPRRASVYIPDLWAKYERKDFRIELEAAAMIGSIENRAQSAAVANDPGQNQSLNILAFGVAAQGEYRFMEGQLRLVIDAGYASGDKAPGFGNYPARGSAGANGNPQEGDVDGRQYVCSPSGSCSDNYIRNFRFDRDYRIDLILFRELLGGVTDTIYVKPSLTYSIAEGFDVFGSVIGSSAVYAESTPNIGADDSTLLGLEANAGARYETEDGFLAQLQWGILFPLDGLKDEVQGGELETAQVLRAIIGVKF